MSEELQLVKVTHERCQEWSGTTYVFAPAEWDEELIQSKIDAAVAEYLAAVQMKKLNSPKPNDYVQHGGPPFAKYPDKTVKEVQELWAEMKAEWEVWWQSHQPAKQKFGTFLGEQGFTSFYNGTLDVLEVYADWGHLHGTRIDYDETETDPTKSPQQVVTGKDPNDPYDDGDFG